VVALAFYCTAPANHMGHVGLARPAHFGNSEVCDYTVSRGAGWLALSPARAAPIGASGREAPAMSLSAISGASGSGQVDQLARQRAQPAGAEAGSAAGKSAATADISPTARSLAAAAAHSTSAATQTAAPAGAITFDGTTYVPAAWLTAMAPSPSSLATSSLGALAAATGANQTTSSQESADALLQALEGGGSGSPSSALTGLNGSSSTTQDLMQAIAQVGASSPSAANSSTLQNLVQALQTSIGLDSMSLLSGLDGSDDDASSGSQDVLGSLGQDTGGDQSASGLSSLDSLLQTSQTGSTPDVSSLLPDAGDPTTTSQGSLAALMQAYQQQALG